MKKTQKIFKVVQNFEKLHEWSLWCSLVCLKLMLWMYYWEDTWRFGAVWGFLQLGHIPTTEEPRLQALAWEQGHCSLTRCCLGEKHVPHCQQSQFQSCQNTSVHCVLSCLGLTPGMTSDQVSEGFSIDVSKHWSRYLLLYSSVIRDFILAV